MKMRQAIRDYSYNPQGAILALNPYEERVLLEWLISCKGSFNTSIRIIKIRDWGIGRNSWLQGCSISKLHN